MKWMPHVTFPAFEWNVVWQFWFWVTSPTKWQVHRFIDSFDTRAFKVPGEISSQQSSIVTAATLNDRRAGRADGDAAAGVLVGLGHGAFAADIAVVGLARAAIGKDGLALAMVQAG